MLCIPILALVTLLVLTISKNTFLKNDTTKNINEANTENSFKKLTEEDIVAKGYHIKQVMIQYTYTNGGYAWEEILRKFLIIYQKQNH